MAKTEILMWVAGIMMMIILGLAVAPTITKSGETAKVAVINSEINAIRSAAVLYSATKGGDYTGLTSLVIKDYLKLNVGWISPTKLMSRADSTGNIEYNIVEKAGHPEQFIIEITRIGMALSTTARASVLATQTTLADSAVLTAGNDLITLTFKQ